MSHCRDYYEREPYTTPMPDVDQATIEALRNQRMNRGDEKCPRCSVALSILEEISRDCKTGCDCRACKFVNEQREKE